MKNEIIKVLKSRTTYTILALVAINVIPEIKDQLSAENQSIANVVLSLATLYFKQNPSQEYGK